TLLRASSTSYETLCPASTALRSAQAIERRMGLFLRPAELGASSRLHRRKPAIGHRLRGGCTAGGDDTAASVRFVAHRWRYRHLGESRTGRNAGLDLR